MIFLCNKPGQTSICKNTCDNSCLKQPNIEHWTEMKYLRMGNGQWRIAGSPTTPQPVLAQPQAGLPAGLPASLQPLKKGGGVPAQLFNLQWSLCSSLLRYPMREGFLDWRWCQPVAASAFKCWCWVLSSFWLRCEPTLSQVSLRARLEGSVQAKNKGCKTVIALPKEAAITHARRPGKLSRDARGLQ